ncbi:MAG TPA: response regulator transcription factor [Bryobacteraceae bacterium]|nr:response regulator transcription factor [Bryobacteraceae bacterium]
MRILVIDDDVELADLLRTYLRREGFQAEIVHEGRAGLERALGGGYELIILDVMLPGMDGFEILKRLREQSRVPVVMLTARGDESDRIVGLETGADDYIPKPFSPRELVARIRAIQRRLQSPQPPSHIEVNGVALDPASREVRCEGRLIELTTVEFDILEQLMRSAGRVLSRDALMEALYNRKASPYDRSLDMHISHLRKKLECGERELIKTIRGSGYQFARTREEAAD